MKKILLVSFVLIGFFFLLCLDAKADCFSINLFYDSAKKTLNFNNEKTEKVFVDKNKFISVIGFADETNSGEYSAKLYDERGEELISGFFSSQAGAFVLDIPYVSIAETLKVTDRAGSKEILNANLLEFKTCDKNKICEFEKGETEQTCIADCGTSKVNYSGETAELLNKNNGIIKDDNGEILLNKNKLQPSETREPQKNSNLLFWIVAGIITLVVVGISLFMIRKRIKKE